MRRTQVISVFVSVLFFLSALVCIAKPPHISHVKSEVTKYYESDQYTKDVKKKLDKVWHKLKKMDVGDKSAIVFDIDDTVLSGYQANKKIGFGDLFACDPNWAYHPNRQAIPASRTFYDNVKKKGFRIFFVTGRPIEAAYVTEQNLQDQGFSGYEKIYFRDYVLTANMTNAQYKQSMREKITKQGYVIEATIGDQESDSQGAYAGIRVKLPNYMYTVA